MEYTIEQLKPYLFGLPWFGQEDFTLKRLPSSSYSRLPQGLQEMANCPAGCMLRFRVQARLIAIECTRPPVQIGDGFSRIGQLSMDFYQDGKWFAQYITGDGYQHKWQEIPQDQLHEYWIYFPYFSPFELHELVVEGDYPGCSPEGPELMPPTPFARPGKLVIYGSSITQGAYASRPALTYPAKLGRCLDMEVVNLGFGET